MASATLHAEDIFPNGTTVSALPQSNYAEFQKPPTANVGAVAATATVTNGVATFTGLADDTPYYATATVGGNFRAVSFRTPALQQAQTVGAGSLTDVARDAALPSSAIAENIPRHLVGSGAVGVASGTLKASGPLVIPAGRMVSSLTFVSGTTALVGGSNQWVALYSSVFVLLGVTDDKLTAAWPANTPKTFTLTSAYTPQTDVVVIPMLCVVATTPPTLAGATIAAGPAAVVPVYWGSSTAGLTNPASAPPTAAGPSGTTFGYCYAS